MRFSLLVPVVTCFVASAGNYSPAFSQPAIMTSTFVASAAASDMYEIQAGQLAQENGASSAVNSFGAHMVQAHTATSAKLKTTLSSTGIAAALPAELDQKHQALLDQLKGAGAQFDTLYLQQQRTAHQEALELMQNCASNGDNAKLKELAGETVPVIQEHIQMLASLTTQ